MASVDGEVNYLKEINDKLAAIMLHFKIGKSPTPVNLTPKKSTVSNTKAWFAFVKEVKEKYPERFVGATIAPEYLAIAKAIRDENRSVYERFKADFLKSEATKEANMMLKKTIGGISYWYDPKTEGLWKAEDNGNFGPWIGYFQPGNEENPILFTNSPRNSGGGRKKTRKNQKKST
jgi:hypothetical protein